MVLILKVDDRGPSCRFTDADVLFLLDFLSDGKAVGRGRLSTHLDIGEGSIRTLLEILESFELICIRQNGVSITDGGMELLKTLGIKVVSVDVPAYVLGKHQQGVIVENASEKVFNGIEQRNAGIRAGGDGCTTWIMEDDRIIMLPNWDVDDNDPQVAVAIRNATNMRNGDVLIIGGGSTERIAKRAAGLAALELV